MKNVKRLISFIAVLTLVFSMTTMALAKGEEKVNDITKNPIYYESISQYTGIPVEKLKKIEEEHGDLTELYDICIDEDRLNYYSGNVTRASLVPPLVVPMLESQYRDLISNLSNGDILVTKDAWTIVVNHGHTCLVDDVYSNGSVYVVEAFGPDTQSNRYKLGNEHNHWRYYNRVRVYYPTHSDSTQRDRAGTFAAERLQDKDYAPFASPDDATALNCATLVWQAYLAQGVRLNMSVSPIGTFTVYPEDFVVEFTTLKYHVNWSGSANVW